jgi:hypothetical protein
VVQILINAGADMNTENRYYSNVLQTASLKDLEKIMQILIDADAVNREHNIENSEGEQ